MTWEPRDLPRQPIFQPPGTSRRSALPRTASSPAGLHSDPSNHPMEPKDPWLASPHQSSGALSHERRRGQQSSHKDRPIRDISKLYPQILPSTIALPSTYRTVKVPARRHIKDTTPHGQVDRPAVLAVVLDKCLGGVGAEYDRGRAARECDGLFGTEVPV